MPMRHATLRQLQVFEAAARHLSFSRAAAELHLTQPGVSMQVQRARGERRAAAVRAHRPPHAPHRGRHAAAPARARRAAGAARGGRDARRAARPHRRPAQPRRDQHGEVLRAAAARALPRAASGACVPARRRATARRWSTRSPRTRSTSPSWAARRRRSTRSPTRSRRIRSSIIAAPGHPLARRRRLPVAALADEIVPRPRARLGHALRDGALLRRARRAHPHRHGDGEQRDDQAGGDGRHGRRVPVAPHDRPRARDEAARAARRRRGCR